MVTSSGERFRLNDSEIPSDPGLYLLYCDAPISALDWNPTVGPAYVGKAEHGLRSRISRDHFGDTGRSTLRRSYGALLKEELGLKAFPRPVAGPPAPVDFTNYTFARPGDDHLTEWMLTHLRVEPLKVWRPGEQEARLIEEHGPPLNLIGWDNPWRSEIKVLRKRCADEARAFGKMWEYSVFDGTRFARARSLRTDYSDHGRWVTHAVIPGTRGRIAYRLVETGEISVLWDESSGGLVRRFRTFHPNELILLDDPPEPWLDHQD